MPVINTKITIIVVGPKLFATHHEIEGRFCKEKYKRTGREKVRTVSNPSQCLVCIVHECQNLKAAKRKVAPLNVFDRVNKAIVD